jgi:hypothetical protein
MAAGGVKAEVFRASCQAGDFLPFDLLRKMVRYGVSKIFATDDCFGKDLADYFRGKSTADGFNFGELRHFDKGGDIVLRYEATSA